MLARLPAAHELTVRSSCEQAGLSESEAHQKLVEILRPRDAAVKAAQDAESKAQVHTLRAHALLHDAPAANPPVQHGRFIHATKHQPTPTHSATA